MDGCEIDYSRSELGPEAEYCELGDETWWWHMRMTHGDDTCRLHKSQGIYWPVEQLLAASKEPYQPTSYFSEISIR